MKYEIWLLQQFCHSTLKFPIITTMVIFVNVFKYIFLGKTRFFYKNDVQSSTSYIILIFYWSHQSFYLFLQMFYISNKINFFQKNLLFTTISRKSWNFLHFSKISFIKLRFLFSITDFSHFYKNSIFQTIHVFP